MAIFCLQFCCLLQAKTRMQAAHITHVVAGSLLLLLKLLGTCMQDIQDLALAKTAAKGHFMVCFLLPLSTLQQHSCSYQLGPPHLRWRALTSAGLFVEH